MVVAIFVFAPVGLPAWWILLLTRVIGVPLVAGISFEVIKFAGRNRGKRWVQLIIWPGMQLQKLTTREPEDDAGRRRDRGAGSGARGGGPACGLRRRPRREWK